MFHFKQFILLVAVIVLYNIFICDSQSCSSYSTQSTCQANSQCTWIDSSGTYYCACASSVPEDVYFLMDISGSIGEEGWIEDTTFVSEMITTGLTNTSRVGIITFGSDVVIKYNLSQTQHPRSIITSLVTGMPYTGGDTYTKEGVQVSIQQFEKWSTKGYPRLLFIITDGKPNPSYYETPCPLYSTLVAENITVFIIGVSSSFSSSAVSCIVTDPTTNIVLATSFSDLASVRDYADNVLCPTSIELTLTEVRVQNTSSTNSAIFIELYNSGTVVVDFKTNPLKFTGVVTGTLNSSINANLSVGQYMVLYKASTNPNCTDCTCSMNSKDRCKNALYIPCNGKNCTFNTLFNGKTVSNTNWGVTVQDTNGLAYVVNVTYTTTGGWPSISTGFTYELQSLLDTDSVGSNWAQSCWETGTPGQGPLTTCTSCKASVCQQNGDSNAKCSGTVCNCTETKDYYSYSGSCYLVPNASSCTTVLHKDISGNSVYISWDLTTLSVGHEFQIDYTDAYTPEVAEVSSNQQFFLYYDSTVTTSTTPPKVRVVVFDNTSTLTLGSYKVVYGSWVPCPITTAPPTKAPTPEPTYGIPTIPCCNATIQGSTGVLIEWCTPSFDYPYTPSSASSYELYITCGGQNYSYYSLSRTYTADPIGSCSVSTSTLTSIQVAPVVELGYTGSANSALMRQYAKTCTILTPKPTKAPSIGPTKPPTHKPTTGPTHPPTPRPTFPYYYVTACQVTINQGDSSITVSYTNQNPSNTSNPVYYILLDKTTSSSSSFLGNPSIFQISGVQITDTTRFFVYPYFLAYNGGNYIGESCCGSTCTVSTIAPSPAPTESPTSRPTGIPTHFPTGYPTGIPTTSPTPFPTYGEVAIDSCSVTVAGGSGSFVISFYEPSATQWLFPYTAAKYQVENGNSLVAFISTVSPGSYLSTTEVYNVNPSLGIYVTVYYGTSHAQGQTIECSIVTQSPTNPPTKAPVTPAPTYSQPTISFDSTIFTATGSGCSYTAGSVSATCEVITGQQHSFRVIRTPAPFEYKVAWNWTITDSARRRMLYNESFFSGPVNGIGITNATNEDSFLYYTYDGPKNTSKVPSFVFTITLKNCFVNDSSYASSAVAYDCSVVPPYEVIVTAVYDNNKLVTNNVLGNLPTWIWYAIAAGVIIIPLLSYLGYRYYKKRKLAELLTEQKKEELKDAEQLDDAANFGGIGDAVAFNPLATGGTHDIATGGQYIDSQLENQKQNFETAHVDVDVINFKQDFGQVQAVKH